MQRGSGTVTTGSDFGGEWLGLEWDAHDRDETWLVSYADILSTILAMVVFLFGRMAMSAAAIPVEVVAEPAAAAAPVELVAGPAAAAAPVELVAGPAAAAAPVELVAGPVAAAVVSEPRNDAANDPVQLAVRDAPPEATLPTVPTAEHRLASLVEQRFSGRIKAEQRSEGLVLTIPEVALFESARAALQASASPLLSELAATLREAGDARISVEGHTDDRPIQGGGFDSNWDLAAARANAVTRYLLERGFEPRRLTSVSYADTRPVADNATAEGRAANRRVELKIELDVG